MSNNLVQKLWQCCAVLRESGVSAREYLEQLTYLLFLKMVSESSGLRTLPVSMVWHRLVHQPESELLEYYQHLLQELGTESGLVGAIFRGACCRISTSALLRQLIVERVNRETWSAQGIDVLAEAYEGLLQQTAEDAQSGAGRYFTPRPLIHAIVEVMRPASGMHICDPACGAGGFLLAAHDYISRAYTLTADERAFLNTQALEGCEIVEATARLCAMNLFLHGIGNECASGVPIHLQDSLRWMPGERFDMVLVNPPFGHQNSGLPNESTMPIQRDDFWVTTTNKHLSFLQLIYVLLKPQGSAAVVIPDNVLFEGGAGETIRRKLLQCCDVHTLLRLPAGIFYATGVKANVVFLTKRPPDQPAQTEHLWVYDLRTDVHCTLHTAPLTSTHFTDFLACYCPGDRRARRPSERFRAFEYRELCARDQLNLDIRWLSTGESTDLASPAEIAAEIATDLEDLLAQWQCVLGRFAGRDS